MSVAQTKTGPYISCMSEYLWYVLASLGAGIGTGFAGLSAATVMVPILIVLCPSFSGENGAYAATAVALASDIIASAVTTAVYWRKGNINLKRGWIMLVCIVSMCILGSFAAYEAGNVVLGSFSLFLTFCIGIRFLVKPDTERKDTETGRKGMSAKDIAISLFFGLTIGFGTGFVGTGGGMMMLIVFTLLLGMDLRSAVGTSTFIMTFTSLIAALSHFLIAPDILSSHTDALLISVAVATVSSLLSAKAANRTRSRTVGLITGGVLTVLGGAMIYLRYRNFILSSSLIAGIASCMLEFCEYVFLQAAVLVFVYLVFRRLPKYIFRKLLHIVAFSSLVEMTLEAKWWYIASLTALLFAALIFPVLKALENYQWYKGLFVEKKRGEVKKSLVLLFGMYAVLVALCWGLLEKRYIAVTAVLMWGVGDAAAAIFGRTFGRHRTGLRHADEKKTWEGTTAMALFSFLAGITGMLLSGVGVWQRIVFYPLLSAPFAAYTELVTKNGDDTVTVPLVTAAVILVLSFMF